MYDRALAAAEDAGKIWTCFEHDWHPGSCEKRIGAQLPHFLLLPNRVVAK